jgi:1,4-dihydroxy-2-naphthoate octaprenyltransferase
MLTPVCVFLGFSTSLATPSPMNIINFILVLTGALFAHISVNTLNEYYDFKSGLDFKTEKTSFSGGSGALPGNPEIAQLVLSLGLVSLLVTIITGFYFILRQGIQVLPIGILGVALIVTYTQWLNRLPLLCLIAPGLGFGVLMVVGTHMVLAGADSLLPWLVSIVPFFLINNLLLLNQYPDIKADADVGRKTFPIAFGLKKSNFVYAVFMIAAYSWILLLIIKGYIPKLSIVALIPMVFSVLSLVGAIKYSSKISDYPRYMAANVAAAILTPLFLGISIIYG